MVILKKVRASTLMETLVATVLIVVIFMLASMILNSLFSNTIKNNTSEIETHLNELEYQYQTRQIELPFNDALGEWQISIEKFKEDNRLIVEFNAVNKTANKTVSRQKFESN